MCRHAGPGDVGPVGVRTALRHKAVLCNRGGRGAVGDVGPVGVRTALRHKAVLCNRGGRGAVGAVGPKTECVSSCPAQPTHFALIYISTIILLLNNV